MNTWARLTGLVMLLGCVGVACAQQDDELDFLFDNGSKNQTQDNQPQESASKNPKEQGATPAQPAKQAPEQAATKSAAGGTSPAKPAGGVRKRPSRRVAVEEIIVTAEKREASIQDVPISIQAFSGDELAAKGITNAQDLQQVTPGLVYNSNSQFAQIYLRGVGTDIFIPAASPSVGTYIDGVYISTGYALAKSFAKIKRISVLKGPQGTLFGRNTTAGAINIVTAEPQDQFQGSVELEAGNYSTRRSKLYVTGPLTDTLALAVSGIYNSKDDYYTPSDNSPLENVPGYRDRGYRAKLRWNPTDWFDATASYYDIFTKGPGTNIYVPLKPFQLGKAVGVQVPENDYEDTGNVVPNGSDKTHIAILDLNFHPGPLDIKTITGYQNHNAKTAADFDGSPNSIVAFRVRNIPSRSFSQEVQFKSNNDGWLSEVFGRPFQWLVGLYYSDTRQGLDPVDLEAAGLGNILDGAQVANIQVPGLTGIFDQLGLDVPAIGATVQLTGIDTFKTVALFTQERLDVFDWLSLTAGARLTHEEVDSTKATLGLRSSTNGQVTNLLEYPDQHLQNTDISPKFQLSLRPTDNSLFYASFTQGFKSGTFNVVAITQQPQEIKPEEIRTVEVGQKATLFGGRVQFNSAIFRNDIENFQVLTIALQSSGAAALENAGKARIDGAEFTLNWAVTPDLIFNAGGSYLDSEFTSFPNASGFDQQSGVYTRNRDFSGNKTPRSPKFSTNAGLFYTLDVWRGAVETGASVYYNDGFFFDNQNTVEQPSYYLVNARLGYFYDPWNVRVTAFGKNLNDAKYLANGFSLDFGTVGKLALPRTYGVRVDWQF